MPRALVVADRGGRALYWNPLAEGLLGDDLRSGGTVPGVGAEPADPAGSDRDADVGEPPALIASSTGGGTLRVTRMALGGDAGLVLLAFGVISEPGGDLSDPARMLREAETIAQLGWWNWDIPTDVVRWSDELYRRYGLAPQSVPVSYASFLERVHVDDRARVEAIIERCHQTGRACVFTHRVVWPDGTVHWQQGRAHAVIVDGRAVRMFGTGQDVTDRVRTEEALRDSLERARRLAVENEALRSRVEAQLIDVRASRARIVEAADEERRRLERDLHDGAQQRLTTLGLILRAAQAELPADADAELSDTLDAAVAELAAGLRELRTLARGLHPTLLTEQGLIPALQSLAGRCPIPVKLRADAIGRLPQPVEVAAYFVVSEALTNVIKHAAARAATVALEHDGGQLVVEVQDDGAGGATIDAGSGLRGLSDRLASIDGRLRLHSPARGGTRLRAELPCA